MKMFPFCLKNPQDIDAAIAEFQKQCPKKYSSILCIVFSSTTKSDTVLALCRQITSVLPEVRVAGNTSSGEIFDGHLALETIIVNFMVFETSLVTARIFDTGKSSASDAAALLREQLLDEPLLKGVGFVTTPSILNEINIFSDVLSELPSGIKIFGCSADSYMSMKTNRDEEAAVFTDKEWTTKGFLLLLFSGEDLNIQVGSYIGWKPLGREVTITGLKNRSTVSSFDNKPAISLYEKYLGIVPEKDFYRPLITFPIIVRRDGHKITRVAYAYEQDGSIRFSGDCRIGERAHLAYGDPLSMRKHLHQLFAEVHSFAPQGILIYSCIVRRLYLKKEVNNELSPFAKIAPTAGAYSFGEIRRYDGYTNVHLMNSALMTIAFREGEKPASMPIDIPPMENTMSEHLSLISGLANFVRVTNKELEQANKELRYLANTDRLTNLLNRGATETSLKEILEGCRRNPEKETGVLMLDLDYFKKVNDTFGHEEGDRVLRKASRIMQASVRHSDPVGRWGGEEFMIILPDCSLETTVKIAETIRRNIRTIILPDKNRMTASIGATAASSSDTIDSLYTRLDTLLYEAKKNGRNRVCADESE
ncbi:MAG: GGDEF domain-containing protein [Schwartzia sp.]|nr:GGDEF domain-containing protein [Schwartzia sp. (in: firmicutes)]